MRQARLTIGIPRAMLYYRYETLWRGFFDGLGMDTVVSGPTYPQTRPAFPSRCSWGMCRSWWGAAIINNCEIICVYCDGALIDAWGNRCERGEVLK